MFVAGDTEACVVIRFIGIHGIKVASLSASKHKEEINYCSSSTHKNSLSMN